jgi:hypothetical protein
MSKKKKTTQLFAPTDSSFFKRLENGTVFVCAFDDENLASLVFVVGFWLPLPLQALPYHTKALAHRW